MNHQLEQVQTSPTALLFPDLDDPHATSCYLRTIVDFLPAKFCRIVDPRSLRGSGIRTYYDCTRRTTIVLVNEDSVELQRWHHTKLPSPNEIAQRIITYDQRHREFMANRGPRT